MQLSLVILAAGLGSRFGGAKQLEAVGPMGATIMDYTVFDALRAGFADVVLVIRPEMRAELEKWVAERFGRRARVYFAEQRIEDVPAGNAPPAERTKPWGTGQAVLAAAAQVSGAFAVANADDFYGAAGFRALAAFLRTDAVGKGGVASRTHGLVGFRLRDTLSEHGSVNRGVCKVSRDGELVEIEEIRGIERQGENAQSGSAEAMRFLSGDTLVSMNLWGFTPDAFGLLREGFAAFLAENRASESAEFQLPTAIQAAIRAGRARVKVLPSPSRWFGLTHREDLPVVRAEIAKLIDQGAYPRELWA